MARRSWLKEKKEILDLILESVEQELSLPQKARAYILLREIMFWEEVRKSAERRKSFAINLLPEKIRRIVREEENE